MARNTSITGSNNFRWTIGDSNTSTYVDKPILKEFYGDSRCSDEFVTFFDLINIGTFTNFGFLNLQPTNIESFINYISEHFKWIDRKLKGQNPDIPTPEPSNGFYWYTGTTQPNTSNINTIGTSVTSKPSWPTSNPQSISVTNTTGVSSYIYYCFPAQWNVTIYDEDKKSEMTLATDSTFTYNNIEYIVLRQGRKTPNGSTKDFWVSC